MFKKIKEFFTGKRESKFEHPLDAVTKPYVPVKPAEPVGIVAQEVAAVVPEAVVEVKSDNGTWPFPRADAPTVTVSEGSVVTEVTKPAKKAGAKKPGPKKKKATTKK